MSEDWQALLHDLRSRHGVVGASLGILKEGRIETCASGLLNVNTGVECTPDSAFQIGSISKVFTATLVMQLVEHGSLALDDRVIEWLPGLALADQDAAKTVTIRQLLNHTCGIDGDFFPPDDPEGPSTTSYLRKMSSLPSLYAPGAGPMTYSNSGYVVAGRIIEVLSGKPWQAVVMDRICAPLDMPAAFAHLQESLRYRCAMGHVSSRENQKQPALAAATYLPVSMAAAGTVLSMSAESLLLFAKDHMSEIPHLASRESLRRMRSDKVDVPPFSRHGVTHWGLGWFLGEGPNYRMAGHDGGTSGQFAYLRLLPESQIAFTLLTNSPSSAMCRELERQLLDSLPGTAVPDKPARVAWQPDPARYVGAYRNIGSSYSVTLEAGALRVRYASPTGTIREFRATLTPYRPDVLEIQDSNTEFDGLKISFLDDAPDGHAIFLRFGLRMARRV
jgi:CubicO group peptidase (beta-lactamase class C family)